MKERIVLGINIIVVLTLVVASSLLANRWRLDGSNYSARRKADGEIEKNAMVSKARMEAGVVLTRYKYQGEKNTVAIRADGLAQVKTIESQGETARVELNNASTKAQADAVRTIDRMSRSSSGSGPQPNVFEMYPSGIDEGKPRYNNLPKPSPFEHLLPKAPARKDLLKKY